MTDHTPVESAVAETIKRVSNWGRWGSADILGTLNFIDECKRRSAQRVVKLGQTISLSLEFGSQGPQIGRSGRFNPVHAMTRTSESGPPRPHGFSSADDVITMPLQCATHWDGLGHIFDRGQAWNGRAAGELVTVHGDGVTGIEKVSHVFATRGVLIDAGRVIGGGELPDGFAITSEHLESTIAAQGATSAVGRGDIVLLRTGQLSRCRQEGWGEYAGGPAPGLSFTTIDWIQAKEIAAIATDTWGAEVRPNEFADAYQPWHQVVIPHVGLYVGEMFDLDALADRCAQDRVYECLLVAAPLRVTGAVGAPVNPIALR